MLKHLRRNIWAIVEISIQPFEIEIYLFLYTPSVERVYVFSEHPSYIEISALKLDISLLKEDISLYIQK